MANRAAKIPANIQAIRRLPPETVNRIAAGEVVQRPASVVKELLENAKDAGSSHVQLIIKDAGKALIQVTDNGCGMSPGDARMCFERHATSKIQNIDDLFQVRTHGFRGEALASIGSVSRLSITSNDSDEGPGHRAASEGRDQAVTVTPAPHPRGTTVEVRDLFFNTPARRRFLRAASTEFGHIGEVVTRLAMVHHAVSFTLTHNNRKTVDAAATESRRQRCVELLGKELDEALLEMP